MTQGRALTSTPRKEGKKSGSQEDQHRKMSRPVPNPTMWTLQ